MNIDIETLAAKAVTEQIAATVIANLTPEHRDAVLSKAVAEALKSYSFKSAVEEAVCKEAAKIAEEMLSQPCMQETIRFTVRAALSNYIDTLIDVLPEAMLRVFGGKDDDRYSRGPGLIHALLKDKLEGKQ